MRFVLRALIFILLFLIAGYLALAVRYWLGWPDWLRTYGSWALVPLVMILWYLPVGRRWIPRTLVVAGLAGLTLLYATKSPYPQDWVERNKRFTTATRDGSTVVIENFRDAVHNKDGTVDLNWETRTYDLDDLVGANIVMQPFGNEKALSHIMLSFRFRDGRNVAVSVGVRQAKDTSFDALAGFFRHDQVYVTIATERDVFGKRLVADPPLDMYFYDVKRPPEAIAGYFVKVLDYTTGLAEKPRFYSTLTESCFTTLIRIDPHIVDTVPWYDIRRWVPGYALTLFQELGAVDSTMPAEQLESRSKLPSDMALPQEYSDDVSWSLYMHSRIGDQS